MAAKDMAMIGAYAFMAGLLVAIVLGLAPGILSKTYTVLLLGVLGIVVGLLNIQDKELQLYLIANIAFLAGSAGFSAVLAALPIAGFTAYLIAIVQNITLFVAPGAAVVALKALYDLSKD
ncbi:Uncharacterised protein [uncultured archaeon]|nr:Uncharacterised protein [uncultured archaeon]